MCWRRAVRMFRHYPRDEFVPRQSGIRDCRIFGAAQYQPDFHAAIIDARCHAGHRPPAINPKTTAKRTLATHQTMNITRANRVSAYDFTIHAVIAANITAIKHINE